MSIIVCIEDCGSKGMSVASNPLKAEVLMKSNCSYWRFELESLIMLRVQIANAHSRSSKNIFFI